MTIAHVDTGREWRGGQAQVLLLLQGLRERGEGVVLAAPDAPLAARARALGIEWIPLRTGGDLDVLATRRLTRALAARSPVLVHAHTARAHTMARAAGAALGIPVVVSRRVVTAIGRNPFSRRKYTRGVARYLCISHAVMDALRSGGVAAARLAWVPSGVDLDALTVIAERVRAGDTATDLRALLGCAPDAPVIGTAGALTPEKAPARFAAAAAEVAAFDPTARFAWIGEGRERASLEAAFARAGLDSRARVLGFRADAHELMAQLTLFVSASVQEGLGSAVLEAQALGVPVVATDSGGVRDSIDDRATGRIVGDARSLGAAVCEALGDPAARRRWSAAALASVRRFSTAAMVDGTLAEYASVLAEAQAGTAD